MYQEVISTRSVTRKIRLLLAFWLIHLAAFPNNISVNNVRIANQNEVNNFSMVGFNLSWENSWRSTSAPANWDAAWVFIKYKVSSGTWQHATLNTTNGNHVAPTGSTIDVTSDGMGAFIYRDAAGSGTFSLTDVRLRWEYGTNGVQDNDKLQIKVFAIEMVYVPQGNFYVGGEGARGSFTQANVDPANFPVPFLITSTPPTLQGNNTSSLSTNLSARADGYQSFDLTTTTNTATLATGYPTGYSAFYCMKYEITQGQYRDFLNSLTRGQQENCIINDGNVGTYAGGVMYKSGWAFINSSTTPLERNGLRIVSDPGAPQPRVYGCDLNTSTSLPSGVNQVDDGEWVVMGSLSWPNLCSYLDWSGLRPMTELEFEKACRGDQIPLANEFAWGAEPTVSATGITNGGSNSETASNSTANVNLFDQANVAGMMRAGAFATGTSSRAQSGASYWGIMELSGNAFERAVTVGNVAGRSYTGIHGNGNLLSDGRADVNYWPGINGNNDPAVANATYLGTTGVTSAAGGGFRGGTWVFQSNLIQVSERDNADDVYAGNNSYMGGRGVRTAP